MSGRRHECPRCYDVWDCDGCEVATVEKPCADCAEHVAKAAARAAGEDVAMDLLVGLVADFYGVDNCCFRLDGEVFEALEDESDGYRSSLDRVRRREPDGLIFFRAPVARVRVEVAPEHAEESSREFSGWQLVDVVTGHVWLRFGTDDVGDYYPGFTFAYAPDPSRTLPCADGAS